ncbi:VQ motif-containing protein 4-like [Durio zibethinus]|uniref:VQ motif-containing protein 4-like n=1 Tax=Durio zibethinus TaxID=66656 RepID=A0A6P5ZM54_DURZI|nr:VQ motif-containing protein 4-like [Durio zibethinus]
MENSTRLVQENRSFPSSPLNSPHGNGNNSSSSSNGVVQIHTPPPTPIPISRSETNPYPTTFVQADTTTFKQVVQMLTGSSETAKQASSKPPTQQQNQLHHHHQQQQQQRQQQQQDPPLPSKTSFPIPPIKTNSPKKQSSKLYERRNSNLKSGFMINTFLPSSVTNNNTSFSSPRNTEILSPSLLAFPKLALSPVTPLNEDPFNKSSPSLGNSLVEEKAIAGKGFYLHPSPMSTPRDTEPQLLPLFPVTSPRVSGSS